MTTYLKALLRNCLCNLYNYLLFENICGIKNWLPKPVYTTKVQGKQLRYYNLGYNVSLDPIFSSIAYLKFVVVYVTTLRLNGARLAHRVHSRNGNINMPDTKIVSLNKYLHSIQ